MGKVKQIYKDLDEYLGRKSDRPWKGTKNNTRVYRPDPNFREIDIRLHDTDIIAVEAKGHLFIDHGGWETVTTKQRINEFFKMYDLPFGVVQKNFEWYFVTVPGFEPTVKIPFHWLGRIEDDLSLTMCRQTTELKESWRLNGF